MCRSIDRKKSGSPAKRCADPTAPDHLSGWEHNLSRVGAARGQEDAGLDRSDPLGTGLPGVRIGRREYRLSLGGQFDPATACFSCRAGRAKSANKIEDAGPLPPHPMDGIKYNMETVDADIRDFALNFIDKAHKDGKPFFCWINPTRMHIVTHLSPKYTALENSENGWSEEEAGMAQLQ